MSELERLTLRIMIDWENEVVALFVADNKYVLHINFT